MHTPTFSIIIPTYNREQFIGRAIASCLNQRHSSFEVIVVDDGSSDDTVARVSAIQDPRLRLFVQPVNRGVSAARNFATDQAQGEWIVLLDSDDELTANALQSIETEIQQLPAAVDGLRFMCRLDDGSLSPDPPLGRELWDYEAYVRWADRASRSGSQETLTCTRRRTYQVVRYHEGGSLNAYCLDFAARFRTATSPAVVRLYHGDAINQISRPNVTRALAQAPGMVRSLQRLLTDHCVVLGRCAPHLLRLYRRGLATQQFLSRDRIGGIATIRCLIREDGGSLSTLAILGLGMLGPRAVARAQAARQRRASVFNTLWLVFDSTPSVRRASRHRRQGEAEPRHHAGSQGS